MKKFVILLFAFLIGAGAGFAQQGKGKGKDDKGGKGTNKVDNKDIPNLTPEQKTKIQEIRKTYNTDIQSFKDQRKTEVQNYKTLMTAAAPDMNAINASLDKISGINLQMAKRNAQKVQDIRKVLDDTQRTWYDQNKFKGKKIKEEAEDEVDD